MSSRSSGLAEAVKTYRQKRNLSQAALAHEAGVSLPTIKRIEAGRNTSLGTIERIAAALSLPASRLLGGEEARTRACRNEGEGRPDAGHASHGPRPVPRTSTLPYESVERARDLWCNRYDDCLEEACLKGWVSWSCTGCPLRGTDQDAGDAPSGSEQVLLWLTFCLTEEFSMEETGGPDRFESSSWNEGNESSECPHEMD